MTDQNTPATPDTDPPAGNGERSGWSAVLPFVPIVIALGVAFGARYYQNKMIASTQPTNSQAANESAATRPLVKAGQLAPDFSLRDAVANEGDLPVTLSILCERSPVMLVFYQSYSCPKCVAHLREIDDRLEDFTRAKVQVVGISPDGAAMTRDSVDTYGGFRFPLLSDTDAKVARLAYGLTEPYHGIVIIDTERRIRFIERSDHPYADIDHLLEESRAIQKEKTNG